MSVLFPHKSIKFKKKALPVFISAGLLSGLMIGGCSNSDSNSSNDTLNVDITSSVPASVVAGNQAILDAEVNVNGGQAANAALFTLGADASDALATITAINYPSVSHRFIHIYLKYFHLAYFESLTRQ